MKKNVKRWKNLSEFFPFKLLLIMKLTVFIICFSVFGVLASNSYSQSAKLTLNSTNTSIKEVLLEIENNSEFFFLYNNNLIDVERKVNINVHNMKINEILDLIFKGQEVDYSIMDRQIIISPRNMNDFIYVPQKQISGKVTDENDQPMVGVTVFFKGTTNGTTTNMDGEYSLTSIPENAVVVFSFVGMRTQEVSVGNQTEINVTLEVDAIGIEEVVAIGYGTVRKSDLTGAVTKVNVDQLRELPNVSVIQSMQGTVPGLNVGAIDRPGEDPSLSIRGQNSLSGSSADNAPLIVVDGSIYRGSLVDINPNDIESVDVLKDASSAAIYGSQASNGVMIITTKKGTNLGKPIIAYSGSYSVETPSNVLTPMNSAELDPFFRDATWLDSRLGPDYLQPNPSYSLTQFLKTNEIVQGYNSGLDEDWWGG